MVGGDTRTCMKAGGRKDQRHRRTWKECVFRLFVWRCLVIRVNGGAVCPGWESLVGQTDTMGGRSMLRGGIPKQLLAGLLLLAADQKFALLATGLKRAASGDRAADRNAIHGVHQPFGGQ